MVQPAHDVTYRTRRAHPLQAADGRRALMPASFTSVQAHALFVHLCLVRRDESCAAVGVWGGGAETARRAGTAGWLAVHVDGVDLGGVEGHRDPGLAGLVAGPQVGAVLGRQFIGEGVVVVG